MEERYVVELGDALVGSTHIMLEQAFGPEPTGDEDFSRFHVQEKNGDWLTIMDQKLGIQALLPRACLRNQEFDLVSWYRLYVSREDSDEYDFASASDSESAAELLSYESFSGSDIPSLKATEHSDDESNAPPQDSGRKVTKKLPTERSVHPPRQLGDVLKRGLEILLEASRPYPGDEDAPEEAINASGPRFEVFHIDGDYYVVADAFFWEVSLLPLEWLRSPTFSLSHWYADIRANASGSSGFEYLAANSATMQEFLADEVQRYMAEHLEEFPELTKVRVSRKTRSPTDEGPDTFLVRIEELGNEFVEFIPEGDLTNPRFDFIGSLSCFSLRYKMFLGCISTRRRRNGENLYQRDGG
ncbi:polyprotein [Mycena venus]|uniref:Polyprotein n=1 Tax=Mycena venus TaxID=2733690 RepID=A0A8H6Z7X3_9AGAR|nr:polyprotein [Mycena venus]